MAKTITSMIKALNKTYPTLHVNIDKRYNKYRSEDKILTDYTLYIEDMLSIYDITYDQLSILVYRYTH